MKSNSRGILAGACKRTAGCEEPKQRDDKFIMEMDAMSYLLALPIAPTDEQGIPGLAHPR